MPDSGTRTIDFGAFPGASDASATVTGAELVGIATSSRLECWIEPASTADHSADEHMLETIKVFGDRSSIVAGTSFVARAINTNQINEPLEQARPGAAYSRGGRGTRLYGLWNFGFAWN